MQQNKIKENILENLASKLKDTVKAYFCYCRTLFYATTFISSILNLNLFSLNGCSLI